MALNSKRTQTFFNEFLITTTQFLNKFMTDCETKFFEFERKLNRIENNLIIIEAKLASVPDENPVSNDTQNIQSQPPPQTQSIDISNQSVATSQPEETTTAIQNEPKIEQTQSNDNLIKISDSYLYKKYFKMIKFGVQPQAVKNKMRSESLDPNLLNDPNLMIEKCPEDDLVDEE